MQYDHSSYSLSSVQRCQWELNQQSKGISCKSLRGTKDREQPLIRRPRKRTPRPSFNVPLFSRRMQAVTMLSQKLIEGCRVLHFLGPALQT